MTETLTSGDAAAVVRRAAQIAAPLFEANNWRYHDKGVPSVSDLERMIWRLYTTVTTEPYAFASCGRFTVRREDPEEGESVADMPVEIHLDLGLVDRAGDLRWLD